MVERVFLGWEAPPLDAAVEWFVGASGHASGGVLDLSGLTVCVPTRRGGRLVQTGLVVACERAGLMLVPPGQVVTPGELAAEVARLVGLVPDHDEADALTVREAWRLSMRRTSGAVRASVLGDGADAGDAVRLDGVADLLREASCELAGAGLRFADVARADRVGDPSRWFAMQEVADGVGAILGTWGLADPDERSRRLAAMGVPPALDGGMRAVVLVCVPSLPGAVGGVLAGMGSSAVTALIAAPESESAGFDACGCVQAPSWQDRAPPLDDASVIFAGDPDDQAWAAMGEIASASASGGLSASDVVIGAADGDLVPAVERASALVSSEGAPLRVRDAGGYPASRTGVGRVLALVAAFLRDRDVPSLLRLVREPDIEAALGASSERGWTLGRLDREAADVVVERLPEDPGTLRDGDRHALADACEGCDGLLAGLVGRGEAAGPIASWSRPILEMLAMVYGSRRYAMSDPWDARDAEGLRRATEGASALSGVPEDPELPGVTSWEAVSLVLERLSESSLAGDPDAGTVEVLGWQELVLDRASVCVVVGVNEGVVPRSSGSSPVVGERVRRVLGMAGDRERLACDAFALTVLSRSRRVRVIAGRVGADGSPLRPSRLLLRSSDASFVSRLRRWSGSESCPARVVASRRAGPGGGGGFAMPAPVERGVVPPVEAMSVTSFRLFLSSPHRFFLERVLSLKEVQVPSRELARHEFGSLVHRVLHAFGAGEERGSGSAARIRAFLMAALEDEVSASFPDGGGVSARLQVRAAEERLSAFASWQAAQADAGWRIERVEWSPAGEGEEAWLPFPGGRMGLRGSIDRIDRHEDGSWRILDYKTSDAGQEPAKTHGGPGRWRDLQLPLYRHLARPVTGTMDVGLGYVNLSRVGGDKAGLRLAAWNGEALADADAAASEVARAVHAGEFDHPGDRPPTEGVLGVLCGSGLILGADAGEPGEAES